MSNSNIEGKSQKIRIKKYGNRRLYDVEHKRYITQYQLMEMIREGHEVQIIDSKTGDDLTQLILTQLILENQKENPDSSLFSSRMLHQLIQYRERYVEEFFQDYLPNILQSYVEWQQETQSQFMRLARLGWFQSQQYSRDFFMPGMDLWRMNPSAPHVKSANGGTASQTEPPSPESERPSEEIEQLKKKVNELENRLNKIPE